MLQWYLHCCGVGDGANVVSIASMLPSATPAEVKQVVAELKGTVRTTLHKTKKNISGAIKEVLRTDTHDAARNENRKDCIAAVRRLVDSNALFEGGMFKPKYREYAVDSVGSTGAACLRWLLSAAYDVTVSVLVEPTESRPTGVIPDVRALQRKTNEEIDAANKYNEMNVGIAMLTMRGVASMIYRVICDDDDGSGESVEKRSRSGFWIWPATPALFRTESSPARRSSSLANKLSKKSAEDMLLDGDFDKDEFVVDDQKPVEEVAPSVDSSADADASATGADDSVDKRIQGTPPPPPASKMSDYSASPADAVKKRARRSTKNVVPVAAVPAAAISDGQRVIDGGKKKGEKRKSRNVERGHAAAADADSVDYENASTTSKITKAKKIQRKK